MKRHKSGGGEEEEEGERHTQRDVNTAHSSSPTRLAQYFSSSLVARSVTLEMIELVQVGSEPIGICLSLSPRFTTQWSSSHDGEDM